MIIVGHSELFTDEFSAKRGDYIVTVFLFTAKFSAKRGMGVNTPLKLFFVCVYYLIRICARFRSTPKDGISGPNLPLNLIFTAFIIFITLLRTLQKHNF